MSQVEVIFILILIKIAQGLIVNKHKICIVEQLGVVVANDIKLPHYYTESSTSKFNLLFFYSQAWSTFSIFFICILNVPFLFLQITNIATQECYLCHCVLRQFNRSIKVCSMYEHKISHADYALCISVLFTSRRKILTTKHNKKHSIQYNFTSNNNK